MMRYTLSIIQSNEYYPFGLQTANSWTRDNTTGNNFLANSATELNTLTQLYDLDYRNYDPILGRMHQVDPLADNYGSWSPYKYAFNSPVNWNDPLGAADTGFDPPGSAGGGFNQADKYMNRMNSPSRMYGVVGDDDTYGSGFAKYGSGDGGALSAFSNYMVTGSHAAAERRDGSFITIDAYTLGDKGTMKGSVWTMPIDGIITGYEDTGLSRMERGSPINLPVDLSDPEKVLQNVLNGAKYFNLFATGRLPESWKTNKIRKTGQVSLTDLFDFKTMNSKAGWSGTGWQQGEKIFNWRRGSSLEISIQEVSYKLGDIGYDNAKRMIYMRENPCFDCASKIIFWIKFEATHQSLYEKARDYVFK